MVLTPKDESSLSKPTPMDLDAMDLLDDDLTLEPRLGAQQIHSDSGEGGGCDTLRREGIYHRLACRVLLKRKRRARYRRRNLKLKVSPLVGPCYKLVKNTPWGLSFLIRSNSLLREERTVPTADECPQPIFSNDSLVLDLELSEDIFEYNLHSLESSSASYEDFAAEEFNANDALDCVNDRFLKSVYGCPVLRDIDAKLSEDERNTFREAFVYMESDVVDLMFSVTGEKEFNFISYHNNLLKQFRYTVVLHFVLIKDSERSREAAFYCGEMVTDDLKIVLTDRRTDLSKTFLSGVLPAKEYIQHAMFDAASVKLKQQCLALLTKCQDLKDLDLEEEWK